MKALTSATFSPHLRTLFRAESEAGPLELTLTEVRPGASDPPKGARAPFALTFRGPPEPLLPQRIYRLEHPEMGALDLFLVPVGADRQGIDYEAVFG